MTGRRTSVSCRVHRGPPLWAPSPCGSAAGNEMPLGGSRRGWGRARCSCCRSVGARATLSSSARVCSTGEATFGGNLASTFAEACGRSLVRGSLGPSSHAVTGVSVWSAACRVGGASSRATTEGSRRGRSTTPSASLPAVGRVGTVAALAQASRSRVTRVRP